MTTRKRTLDEQHSIIEAAHDYSIIFDAREIFMSGEVDMEGDLGDRFIKNMRLLLTKSEEPIVIHQHSLGGDWCCGMMVFDAILNCPCPIIFICHGLAASMGSILPMACHLHGNSYVINSPSCDWLVHDGTTDISPGLTYKQARSWGDWEKRTRDFMVDCYVTACCKGSFHEGRSKNQVKSYIKRQMTNREDWWLTSREAVEHGFANAVLGDEGFENIKAIKDHW